jgi:hypothetical protein
MATADLGRAEAASPVAGQSGDFALAWSAAGDRILIGHAGGGILEVTTEGTVREILSANAAPAPRAVAWSPSGAAIAFVDAGTSGTATGLYVASTDVLPVDPVAVVRPIEGQSRQIVAIEWPTGDAGILYSERAPNGDLSVGGDLFAVSPAGGKPQLVASARSVAQVAAVDSFEASPDGVAVAYTVVVPGDGGSVSGDLLVKQIGGPTVVDLAVSGVAVESIGWTAAGLTWITSQLDTDDVVQLSLQHARSDGTIETIYQSSAPATPGASPAASPVASQISDASTFFS